MKKMETVLGENAVNATTEMEREATTKFYMAGHKFIDDCLEILCSDVPNPVEEKIEILHANLFTVIRDVRISIHPIVYAEIQDFNANVFEQLYTSNSTTEKLETLNDWIDGIQSLRNYFEIFADEVLIPYLWG